MSKMLDIYLYRRNKKRKRITIKDSNKELIGLLEQSPIKELRELKELLKLTELKYFPVILSYWGRGKITNMIPCIKVSVNLL